MKKPVVEKVGGLTFRDGVLVSGIDAEAEIAKRGGIDRMFEESLKHNAFMRQWFGKIRGKRRSRLKT